MIELFALLDMWQSAQVLLCWLYFYLTFGDTDSSEEAFSHGFEFSHHFQKFIPISVRHFVDLYFFSTFLPLSLCILRGPVVFVDVAILAFTAHLFS